MHKVAAAGFTSLSMSEWKGLYWNSINEMFSKPKTTI